MGMADGHASYPSASEVDSGTTFPPPLLPKPGQTRIQNGRSRLIQNTLLVLVCLALLGLLVEGYFIYQLYTTSGSNLGTLKTEALKADLPDVRPVTKKPKPRTTLHPSKPLAHLPAGWKKPEKNGTMEWNEDAYPIYKLDYKNGKLIIQKEGFYYVYAKLSFGADGPSFVQTVKMTTPLHMGVEITLLTYRRHSPSLAHKGSRRSSYLGGVFHLHKGDAVFVYVNDGSLVRLHKPADNFFGMFML